MQKIILYIVAATLFCVQAQETNFQLYEQLPDRTLAMWRCEDISASKEAMKETSIYKLFYEEEVQFFLKKMTEPYQGEISQALQQVEGMTQMPLEELVNIFDGELAIAVTDVDMQNQAVGAVFSLEFGKYRENINTLLEIAKQMSGVTFSTENYNGYDLHVVNEMPPHMKASYAFVGNTLLIASTVNLLKEVITGSEGLRLKDSENLKAIVSKVHREGVPAELFYVNVEALRPFMEMGPPREVETFKKLGLFSIKSWGVGANIKGDYINVDSYLHCSEKKGILSFLDMTPVSPKNLHEVPSHSNGFMSLNLDISSALNKIKVLLNDIDPSGGMLRMYAEALSEIENQIGFSLEDDLVKLMNPSGNFYSYNYMPKEGGMLPRTISAAKINVDASWEFWNKISKKMSLELKEISFADKKIHYFSQKINMPLFNGGNYRSFEKIGNLSGMAFFIEDDMCYFGANMHDIKSFMEERESWEKGLHQNDNFSELSVFLSESTSIIWYMDLSEIFDGFWNTSVPILRSFEGFARKAGIPFSTAYLPQAKTISQHLKPAMFSYASDENGFLMSLTSSFAISAPMVIGIGVGAAIAIPAIEKQKKMARQSSAKARLHSILNAQHSYMGQEGKYASIQTLNDMGYIWGVYNYGEGKYEDGTYMYYMYVTTEAKKEEDNANAAASTFVLYAWPMYDQSLKTFAINQEGKVVSTRSTYSSWLIPKADAALAIDSENFAENATGRDANFWLPEK